jgi:anthranilate synthase/aminodeoxychorismate synthase-like glutamine amidotransferase
LILLLDNYDSFVHNLARFFEELGCETQIVRNDAITVEEIRELHPEAIVLSPGPCTPADAGICEDVIRQLGPAIPMLGVCLGHQAIATALGGRIRRADKPVHGLTSQITHQNSSLFAGMPNPLTVTRYHSLIVEEAGLPDSLIVTSRTSDGIVMSLEHREWKLTGVQFHPESVLTEHGHDLLSNFLKTAGIRGNPEVPREQFPHENEAGEDWKTFPNMRPISW